ncbi:tyrosine-type recombinase/integrase [Anabaena sphaerica FACHB-251]|uniref:Tyrosine-type recombinase/integrase n=1 Tax=Anabaena sphaerica FACHB-251 TaxID=2692883 RepID=A0A926WMJ0_9NOST|nr:tyrosine-type recombinase/integrase [Anabaena sphaerica]MBD2296740.1 tyrosine-type recombinase/integrase [Anabaena sphaerica FACHB-251]
MEALQIRWSLEKQQKLADQLQGYWAEDKWCIGDCPIQDKTSLNYHGKKSVYFECLSPSLNAEIKYACWQKMDAKEWQIATLWRKASEIRQICSWLNTVSDKLSSLMERDVHYLATSFRSYLLMNGMYRSGTGTALHGNQQLVEYSTEDPRIYTLSQIYKFVHDFYDDRDEYKKDVWDIGKLGIKCNPSRSIRTLNFSRIQQLWLRDGAKRFIKYTLAIYSLQEAVSRLQGLVSFSIFVSKKYPQLLPEQINRFLVEDYLSYLLSSNLAEATRHRNISILKAFLEICAREEWLNVPDKRLIYQEDFPSIPKRQPRFIPEEVMQQLNQNLDKLEPTFQRMVLILQDGGMRISELCRMPFNCLTQDLSGDYFLHYYQYKMKKDHSIPISLEIAAVIQEQQKEIRQQHGDYPYLFASTYHSHKKEAIKQGVFSKVINQLAYDCNICDKSGTPWRFQAHQFRHTVGTRMINLGVPQHIIQRFLGHETPEMTSVYAHIHDQTLKEEFAKFKHRMVDVTGKVVEPDNVKAEMTEGIDPNSIDEQWMRKNILAQALPNGLCGLPIVQGVCPYGANKCLSCTHFKTDTRYLDKHKDHLERTTNIVEWAYENQDSRRSREILKENLPVKENLERIITALEEAENEA